jgi:hypothetical protein
MHPSSTTAIYSSSVRYTAIPRKLAVRKPAFFFLEADTALYIGYISSNSLFTEENKELEAHTGLYQPLKKKKKIKKRPARKPQPLSKGLYVYLYYCFLILSFISIQSSDQTK